MGFIPIGQGMYSRVMGTVPTILEKSVGTTYTKVTEDLGKVT